MSFRLLLVLEEKEVGEEMRGWLAREFPCITVECATCSVESEEALRQSWDLVGLSQGQAGLSGLATHFVFRMDGVVSSIFRFCPQSYHRSVIYAKVRFEISVAQNLARQ